MFDVVAVVGSAATANVHPCAIFAVASQLQLTADVAVMAAVVACSSSCRN